MNAADATCPECLGPLVDATTMEWTAPFHAFWVIGYCPRCSKRFHQDLETRAHGAFTWAPLCHVCGRQVRLDRVESDETIRWYRCVDHRDEVWQLGADDRWTWRGAPTSPSAA